MAKNIKGITIEIGGNTTKLEEALKGVNKIVYSTNAELRNLNQALKLDPKNTELLSQKQEVLRNNIKATTERLQTLKEAQRQMGDYNSLTEEQKEQYRALSVEITKGENALKGMKKELLATNGINLDKLKEGLKKVGEVAADVAKKMAKVTAAVGGALAGIVTAGVKSYADLEQNLGGVETLFGKSADKVVENAKKAYATAGVSANEYMQGVTSFSASLLQSLGGDTEKAADVADMAFRDMSDNANKFGTDMSSIQNAYQGFAKQNYTMLDNLKLGYGGTKTEMQRLLADAQKITGVKYDIKNLSDVYQAIHVIQEQMDISGYSTDQLTEKIKKMALTEEEIQKVAKDTGKTYDEVYMSMLDGTLTIQDAQVLLGTTAKEAAGTISGSIGSMKAAFDNFLNGSGSPEQLAETMTWVFTNVTKAVKELAPAILTGLVQLTQTLVPQIAQLLLTLIPQLLTAITNMINALLQMVTSNMDAIANAVSKIITAIVTFITQNLPTIIELGIKLLIALAQGIADALPDLIPAIVECITTIITVIVENLPLIIETGLQLLIALIEGIIQALPQLANQIPQIIETIVSTIIANLPMLLKAALQLIIALAKGLIQYIPTLLTYIPKIIAAIVKGLIEGVPKMISSAGDLIKGLVQGMKNKLNDVKEAASKIIEKIKEAFTKLPEKAKKWGKDMMDGIKQGIKDKLSAIGDAVKGVADKIKSFLHFSRPDEGPLREYETWMPDFVRGLARTLRDSSYLLEDASLDMATTLANNTSAALRGLNAGVNASLNPTINPSYSYDLNYQLMAQAMKEALKEVNVELDDRELGKFIDKQVSEEVYS